MTGDELIAETRKNETILLNFFIQHGVSYSDARDMVQEVYLRLWKYRDRYRPSAGILTFLFLVARQVWLDSIRSGTRRLRREEAWSSERPETVDGHRYCLSDDVCWALAKLPDGQRQVVVLGVLEERPYAEIAERLGIPLGTVKSRMSSALKKLKEIFDDERS